MVDINVASPDDTDLVSNYPADERASRAALLSLTNGTMFGGGTTGGSGNAQTLTISNTGVTLTAGMLVWFNAGFTNTGAMTLQVNSLAATTCYLPNGTAISGSHPGAVRAGTRYVALLDGGTSWIILNASGYVDQTEYDLLYPVGATKLHGAATTPPVPYGVTATWALEAADNLYLRGTTGTPIAVGGSLTTGAEAGHTHTYSGTTSGPSGIFNVEGGAGNPVATSAHTHTFSGTTSASSSHTHSIEPSYVTYRLYRRTA